jgi:methylmalonyl-CoA/ethylmalonyl-CoA epimerase
MSAQEQSFHSTLPHHVGVVVRDIEKAIAHLEALGFGPFRFDDEHRTFTIPFKGELHGQPAEWKTTISNAQMGEIQLELLEPTEGPQALKETLDAQGEGLHHIGWLSSDVKGEIEKATAKGAKVWTSSFPEGEIGFCYFEGTDLGNIAIELREP